MKLYTIALCLITGLMASGCIIVHETKSDRDHDDVSMVSSQTVNS